jgi:hypothetical protein
MFRNLSLSHNICHVVPRLCRLKYEYMKTFRIPYLERRVQVPFIIVLFLLNTFSRILHLDIVYAGL